MYGISIKRTLFSGPNGVHFIEIPLHYPFGGRVIDRLSLGFSHLRKHKFRHSFPDAVNPLCSCTFEIENAEHFFLRCQNKLSATTTLKNELNNINNTIIFFTSTEYIRVINSTEFIRVILYGDKHFDNVTNFKMITATIKFIKTMKRFEALF